MGGLHGSGAKAAAKAASSGGGGELDGSKSAATAEHPTHSAKLSRRGSSASFRGSRGGGGSAAIADADGSADQTAKRERFPPATAASMEAVGRRSP